MFTQDGLFNSNERLPMRVLELVLIDNFHHRRPKELAVANNFGLRRDRTRNLSILSPNHSTTDQRKDP